MYALIVYCSLRDGKSIVSPLGYKIKVKVNQYVLLNTPNGYEYVLCMHLRSFNQTIDVLCFVYSSSENPYNPLVTRHVDCVKIQMVGHTANIKVISPDRPDSESSHYESQQFLRLQVVSYSSVLQRTQLEFPPSVKKSYFLSLKAMLDTRTPFVGKHVLEYAIEVPQRN